MLVYNLNMNAKHEILNNIIINYMSSSSLLLFIITQRRQEVIINPHHINASSPSSWMYIGFVEAAEDAHGQAWLLYGSTQPEHLTGGMAMSPTAWLRCTLPSWCVRSSFPLFIAYQDAGHDFSMDAIMTYTKRLVSENMIGNIETKSNI